MTAEQQKAFETLAELLSPKTANAQRVHDHIIAARDFTAKSVYELNQALGAITGGDTMPTVTDTVTVPYNWPKPDPIVPEPAPEPEKTSKWGKFKSVFKKVWPVATVGLAFVPGGSIITGVVNAVAGAGTLDMATVTTAAGAAGVVTAATAGVSAWRNATKEEEGAKE